MTTDQIKQRILNTYVSAQVEVTDLTGTSDHIQVQVVTEEFQGKTRIQRQRMVMDIFAAELKTGEVHALTIRAVTPAESTKN